MYQRVKEHLCTFLKRSEYSSYNVSQRYVPTYVLLLIIQRKCDTFRCGRTDSFKHDLCCIYQRQSQIHRSSHWRCSIETVIFEGAPSSLRQFLATENSLKIMKNAFYFTLKALLVLKILDFCLEFSVMSKRLDQKGKVNFKIYDVTVWLSNNCNTHIDQYLKKKRQSGNKIWSANIA